MSIVYKTTITRPSFDSLCFMEATNGYDLTTYRLALPTYTCNIRMTESYDPMITWSELYARKHELRADLLVQLNLINIESIISNPNIYAPYPSWNPFSLSWTHLIAFATVDKFAKIEKIIFPIIEKITGPIDIIKGFIYTVGSTVTYEELLIDGIPDPTFLKNYL